jgi:hypothetical protein
MTLQWHIKQHYSHRLERREASRLPRSTTTQAEASSPVRLRACEGRLEMAPKKVLLLCGDYMEDYEVSSFSSC